VGKLTQQQALDLCRKYGAFYTGHFIGTQGDKKGLGRHMPEYFDSRTLITYPEVIAKLASAIAEILKTYQIDVVAGMPLGAYTLGHEVAKALKVRYAMPEKKNDQVVVHRSAFIEVITGKRVAVIEDTVNAGETLTQGIKAIKECGGKLVVIGALFDRGLVDSKVLGAPYRPLITRPASLFPSFTLEECLASGQCARSEPINRKPGHGHDLEKLVKNGVVPAKKPYSFID
jgi:orotate phosphoribosyltransferase